MKIHKQSNDSPQYMAKQPDVCPHWPKALVAKIYGEYEGKPTEKKHSRDTVKVTLPQ